MDNEKRQMNVRVSDELYERIKQAAERDRRSMNQWVQLALEQAVSNARTN